MNRPLFPPRITRILEIGAVGAVIVLYIVLKANTLRVTASDEGVYYYAAKLWLDGVLPYRDFFISHPPIHLLVPTIAMWFFGINIRLLNAIPSVLESTISGILVFRIAKREWGFLGGFLASLFFLFSSNELLQSNHFTGVGLALTFLLAGIDFFFAGRGSTNSQQKFLWSGIAFGFGMMTGAYVLPGFFLLGFYALFAERSAIRPLLTGFGLVVVPMHLLFMAIAGNVFLEDVYLYHLKKVADSPYFANVPSVILAFIRGEQWLAFPALVGIHAFFFSPLLRQKELPSPLPLALNSSIFLLDYLLFFSFMNRVFRHYLLLTLPFLAFLATFGFLSLFHLHLSFPEKWRIRGENLYKAFVAVGMGGALVWFLLSSVAPYARIAFSYSFMGVHDIALYVKKNLEPGETLYGDFGVTPLVSLLSGVRIAANEVDSSVMRFESGFSSATEVMDAIEADHVGALILRRGTDIEVYPAFRKYIEKYFSSDIEFVGADSSGNVEVWRRKKEVPYTGIEEDPPSTPNLEE